MRTRLLLAALLFLAPTLSAPAQSAPDWKARLQESMPLLGHRNWILVVDSAYPLQTSPGLEVIETNSSQLDVVRSVLDAVQASIHVRPVISMDAELPHVPEQDAPGVTQYRTQIHDLLKNYPVELVPHDKVIADIDQTGKSFRVLVLKTTLAIPYTSVFIRLDCKYWSADAEKRLRETMSSTAPGRN